MTAEVAIINNQAIVLAADSAVTTGRRRVWKHANKIFASGPNNDVGIMIYNSGDFLGIPWEIIVKEHRRDCRKENFQKLEDFTRHFFDFLHNKIPRDPVQEENSIFLIIVDILESMEPFVKSPNRLTLISRLESRIEEELKDLNEVGDLGLKHDRMATIKHFNKALKDLSKDILNYTLPKKQIDALGGLLLEYLSKQSESEFSTGIVFAGFGRSEMLPSIRNYIVDGSWKGKIRYWETLKKADLNAEDANGSGIIPYAQADMAYMFLEGIYPRFIPFLMTAVQKILEAKSETLLKTYIKDDDERLVEEILQKKDNDSIVQDLFREFAGFRQREFTGPLLVNISALPKEEMAVIAKAIVELTAVRRKFASALESVGGDVDVAILSKSDGFIWKERKHYFRLDLNPDFLDRRRLYRGDDHASHQADDSRVSAESVAGYGIENGKPGGSSKPREGRRARRKADNEKR